MANSSRPTNSDGHYKGLSGVYESYINLILIGWYMPIFNDDNSTRRGSSMEFLGYSERSVHGDIENGISIRF